MDLWFAWTAWLADGLDLLTHQVGLSQAMAVIVLTLMARLLLLPVSLGAALRMEANKVRMKRLKPELEALKSLYAQDAAKLSSETLRLYRTHQVRLFDRLTLANLGAQSVFGIGFFQVLHRQVFSTPFLWMVNLAKPDLWLTLLVSLIMLLGMALMPGATAETSTLLMMLLSVAVATLTLLAMPSAIGLYWATSNLVTVGQAMLLRGLLRRQNPLLA